MAEREQEYVSNQIAEFGPVLTDEEFFSELDEKISELNEAKEAYFAGDKALAYKKFTDYIKADLKPDAYFSMGGAPDKPVFDEKLKEKAELAMKHYFVSCGIPMQFGEEIDWLANPTPDNYSEWRIQLHRHAEFITLSNAYRASGDERYAEELVKLMLHWIKHVPRCEYTSGSYGPTQTWRTLECGNRCNCWTSFVHSLLKSPYFTDEACVTIYKSLYENQMRVASAYTHGNWLFIELNGVATASVASPVFKKSREWRDDAANRLIGAMEAMVYPDGWQYELAPGYVSVCMTFARGVERIFSAYGLRLPDKFYEIMNSMVDCFVKCTMANGMVPPINDSEYHHCSEYVGSNLRAYGGSDGALWFASGKKEGKAPEYNSILMPYAGFAALRTGWGEDDISAFFDAGKYGRDHFHEDKLNLLVYSSKKAILTECGTYAYDSSMMRNYSVNTEGHNTVMVDGLGQCRFEEHWGNSENWAHTKEEVYLLEDDRFDYAWGCYRDNYGVCDYSKHKRPAVKGRPLAEHVREVILMKHPKVGKPYFLAVDTMTDKVDATSHTYEALWHMDDETIEIDGNIAYTEDATLFTTGFEELRVVKGQEEPFQGWLSTGFKQGEYHAAPTLICKAEGKNAKFATLCYIGSKDECPIKGISLDGGSITVSYENDKCDTINIDELAIKKQASQIG